MSSDVVLWYAARVAALAAFTVLSASLLTGMAIRTALLAGIAKNKPVLVLHTFLSWFWIPLVGVHVVALLLDGAAHIRAIDVVVPFIAGAPYSTTSAKVAIGLGTVALLLIVLVGITSAVRTRMSPRVWLWTHRLTYPMFVVFVVHAQLAGSDFSRPWISIIGWATLGSLVMLALPRAAGARVETPE